ncbi:FAD binding domain protein [Lophiostoma macrostomum CBS 122681]|uniref:FAD binding domain protein n=1 Tax=Lophiostoma macrostomum CBS 122681 TaxID=1314788 RepID=A0A6A6STJ4_9PLEO|nr:FAD binding domain protein [Lophiostoma macrostomum CBS 122681]
MRNPVVQRQASSEVCKIFPGDDDWPSKGAWAQLNDTVAGALFIPVPRAAVCHSSWPHYDPAKCEDLLANWNNFEARVSHPTDLIYTYFQGDSCLPDGTLNASTSCTRGGDPSYVIRVTTPEHISAAIKFAKKYNIRLIVKNTGHDVAGKSTGAGSLSVWTHKMKQIDWLPDYQSDYYSGAAMRVSAGVSLKEYYQAAEDRGVTVVGGECSTVGVAGGYSAGGGHSPAGGLFGMAADNVVELTAVLPNGTHMTISSITASELFWAFRGGGGATFGVVTSITVKAHPKHMPAIADSGSQCFAGVYPIPEGGLSWYIYSFVAPNMTIAQYDALMAPYFNKLSALGISTTQNTTFHESYFGAWRRAFPEIDYPYTPDPITTATGSRLFPRRNFEDSALLNQTLSAWHKLIDLGTGFIWYTQKNEAAPGISNAINPAYRDSLAFVILSGYYYPNSTVEEINSVRDMLTNTLVPLLKEVTPGSGTYLNEADVREPDWQQNFYGSHYERLLSLKNELDPNRVFWAKTAVGSEDWYIEDDHGLPEVQTGRLCRKA